MKILTDTAAPRQSEGSTNIARTADDRIAGGGNDCGELGVTPLRHALSFSQPELPHGAADRAPEAQERLAHEGHHDALVVV
jgi:hypothetical protein